MTTEITADHLAVEGTLPPDLTGHYVRNGPNPEFVPLGSYTHPLEGDGLVHRVWLEGGAARYANRWVRTNGLKAEERAGHAPYGGSPKTPCGPPFGAPSCEAAVARLGSSSTRQAGCPVLRAERRRFGDHVETWRALPSAWGGRARLVLVVPRRDPDCRSARWILLGDVSEWRQELVVDV